MITILPHLVCPTALGHRERKKYILTLARMPEELKKRYEKHHFPSLFHPLGPKRWGGGKLTINQCVTESIHRLLT